MIWQSGGTNWEFSMNFLVNFFVSSSLSLSSLRRDTGNRCIVRDFLDFPGLPRIFARRTIFGISNSCVFPRTTFASNSRSFLSFEDKKNYLYSFSYIIHHPQSSTDIKWIFTTRLLNIRSMNVINNVTEKLYCIAVYFLFLKPFSPIPTSRYFDITVLKKHIAMKLIFSLCIKVGVRYDFL